MNNSITPTPRTEETVAATIRDMDMEGDFELQCGGMQGIRKSADGQNRERRIRGKQRGRDGKIEKHKEKHFCFTSHDTNSDEPLLRSDPFLRNTAGLWSQSSGSPNSPTHVRFTKL